MSTQPAAPQPANPTQIEARPAEDWETIFKRHVQPITMWGPHYYEPDYAQRLHEAVGRALQEIEERCKDE